VYADFCIGEIRSLQLPSVPGGLAGDDCSLGLPLKAPTSFGEDGAGRLYVASSQGGVYRIAGSFEGCPEESPSNAQAAVPAAGDPLEPRLRISAQRRRGAAAVPFLISVEVAPCTKARGGTVLLRRGGEANGSKRAGADCAVRFRRLVRARSTFRAKLSPRPGEVSLRSRRLTLEAQ
jgi:hypothetical protein